jgi:hypothetical protein
MFWTNLDYQNPTGSGNVYLTGVTMNKLIWNIGQLIVNAPQSPWEVVTESTPQIGSSFASTITSSTDNNTAGLHLTLAYKPDNADYSQGRLFRIGGYGNVQITGQIIDLKTAPSGGISKWALLYTSSIGTTSGTSTTRGIINHRAATGGSGALSYDLRVHIIMEDDYLYIRGSKADDNSLTSSAFIFTVSSFPDNNTNRDNIPGIYGLSFNNTTSSYNAVFSPGHETLYDGKTDSSNTGSFGINANSSGRIYSQCGGFIGQPHIINGLSYETFQKPIGVFSGDKHARLVGFLGVIPGILLVRGSAMSLFQTVVVDSRRYIRIREVNPPSWMESPSGTIGYCFPVEA